jgi:hypothetical protein
MIALNRCCASDGSPPGNRSLTRKNFVANLSDTATIELIQYANKVSVELWPDPPAAAGTGRPGLVGSSV